MSEPIRLTQYSHGAGCGCKISPKVLDVILAESGTQALDPKLWVGNASRDDAAVYALDDERGVVSTTDFFMPIVDDPYDFGRIAATNAISDIYAMGGDPLMAIAILGWPVNVLPPEVAREVIRGGRAVCAEAGIPLAGGHSIDAPEPIFGLAVTGVVNKRHLKRNDTASAGASSIWSRSRNRAISRCSSRTTTIMARLPTSAAESLAQSPRLRIASLAAAVAAGVLGQPGAHERHVAAREARESRAKPARDRDGCRGPSTRRTPPRAAARSRASSCRRGSWRAAKGHRA